MRKILLGVVAAAAIATSLVAATAANATVAVNEQNVGHIDKGDIQVASVLNLNNGEVPDQGQGGRHQVHRTSPDGQTTPAGPASDGSVGTVDHSAPCSPARSTPRRWWNGNHSQILGFEHERRRGLRLLGVRGERIGTMGACPAGSYMTGSRSDPEPGRPVRQHGWLPGGVKVNGIDLPNTPVVLAPVA